MFETRPDAVLSFGDLKVVLPKEVVGMLEKVVLEDAIKRQNFDAYDLAKGVHELNRAICDWRAKDTPMESEWIDITFDLRTLENAGNDIPNIFALLHEERPRQHEFYGEVIDAARIVSVVSTIDDHVSVGSKTDIDFAIGAEGTRYMHAAWRSDYNGKDYGLTIGLNGQTGQFKLHRDGDVSQITLAFRRTWVRSNVQVGKLTMTQQELTYLAENPDVRRELDRLIDKPDADKPMVADVEILDIDFVAAEGGTGHCVGQGSFAVARCIRTIKPVKINGLPLESLLKIDEVPAGRTGTILMKEDKQVLIIDLDGKNADIVRFVREEWIKNATFEVEFYNDPYRL